MTIQQGRHDFRILVSILQKYDYDMKYFQEENFTRKEVSILQKYDYDTHQRQSTHSRLSFNSTKVRLWLLSVCLLCLCLPCFNSTEVRLWLHLTAGTTPNVVMFQFYRSTIMTVTPRIDIVSNLLVSILQKYDYDYVWPIFATASRKFQFYRSTIMTIIREADAVFSVKFQFYRSTIMTFLSWCVRYGVWRFNSTEVRLWPTRKHCNGKQTM